MRCLQLELAFTGQSPDAYFDPINSEYGEMFGAPGVTGAINAIGGTANNIGQSYADCAVNRAMNNGTYN